MKLKTIKKLLFPKRVSIGFSVLLLLYVLVFPLTAKSQQQEFFFENTPVPDALNEATSTLGIRISFDTGELARYSVSAQITGDDPLNILSGILKGTPYHVVYKYNTYLVLKKESLRAGDASKNKEFLFSGIIFDRETGERLPYASVRVLTKKQMLFSTVSGTFSTQIGFPHQLSLQISYLGYYALDTLITVSANNEIFEFGLVQKDQAIAQIDVKADKLKMVDLSEQAGHFTFNPSRFSDLPNYGETDIFKALQLLPGISMQENSSRMNIRGSAADQTLVLFDGFTLYNLDHFFGVFSALNPNIVKNIQVYRGGFDSSYGERISGIVDITGKSGNRQKMQLYGGVNMISGNLAAEIPVSKKITLVAAARRAYSDIYSSWIAKDILNRKINNLGRLPLPDMNVITPEFYFNDQNLKLTFTPNKKESFSFSYYGAKDHLNSSDQSEDTRLKISTEDMNEWGNYGFGFSWGRQWNMRWFSRLQVGHSGYFNNYFNKSVITSELQDADSSPSEETERSMVTNENNELTDYFVSLQNEYFVNSDNQLEFGLSAKYNRFGFYKDASQEFIYNELHNAAWLYSGFVQDKISLTEKLFVKPGVRLNLYNRTGKFYFEPRFAAFYKTDFGLSYKLAMGRYFQFLNKSSTEQSFGYNRDFWVLADDRLHPVVSSNHFIAGASYKTGNLFFDVEAYYKSVNGLQEYLFFQDPENRPGNKLPGGNMSDPGLSEFISGKGKAYGIDFLAKYEGVNFTTWLAYSLSKSTQHFVEINGGSKIPAAYDRPHEIKWTNIYSRNRWTLSSLALFTSGLPYVFNSDKAADFATTRTYSRLPDYFRIDFSVNYNFNLKGWNLKPGLSILNAMNTANYLDIYTRDFSFQGQQEQRSTLVKAQGLTFNFFVNFRF
ncbi:Outer membrane receptor for ferrienterochelin and colicins [Mariniphaga anaerophila]|uniref:Outer membrane receptor for ferrienterochelin and colicins n=1 Tax=Mariniphaga anaerophila TaxID=1484053 RepID=A0A1M4TML6_9BACT|nr:TonB-dependent receptor plug domain-containing protein [Mariniphaga anaerophila]SHE45723.1 Outer membrane receptor for ferrienterochelin and colicins [Mariniphaga anaerophila]